jgi:oxygen-independent coproporphyrinogen-3 oxidase
MKAVGSQVAKGRAIDRQPRAAYVHVPFCRHHCGYCNFTVVAGRDGLAEAYLEALARELSWLLAPRDVDSLFIGGGTPTHLPLRLLDRLLELATRWFVPQLGCEFTVEANPGDVSDEVVGVLADRGVTRLSLGAQSLNRTKLRVLERDHEPDDVRSAVERARPRIGSVSLDLIFAAPNETLDEWQCDLEGGIELAPHHISTYGLTYERGTTFYGRLIKGELVSADEERQREMYLLAIDRLTAAGFEHYEVSNFARSGHRCRHNESTWLGRGYYAAGAGAARYVDGRRETNHRSTTTYLHRVLSGQSPVAESETLGPEDRARELLVLGMRRREGVERRWFHTESGFTLDELFGPSLAEFVSRGLLEDTGRKVRLSREGLLVSDAMWPAILRS